jgi:Domain of unknown function (DUF4419)
VRSVNAHAEELRSFFVQHEGQRELEVEAIGDRYTVDFGAMVQCMGQQLKENVRAFIQTGLSSIVVILTSMLDQRSLAI